MVSSEIIYKYLCGQCNCSYVGETRRHFISRICEHKGISPRTNVPFVNPPFSNIRELALNCNHPIKIDNFSVLARCQDYDLRLLESIFIHKLSPNLITQLVLAPPPLHFKLIYCFLIILGPCQTSVLAAAVAKRPGLCETAFERGYIDSYVKR